MTSRPWLQSRYYNALLKAQHYLNYLLAQVFDSIYLAGGFLERVAVARARNDFKALQVHIGRVSENMLSVRASLKNMESEAQDVLAEVRAHARFKPIALRILGVIGRSGNC